MSDVKGAFAKLRQATKNLKSDKSVLVGIFDPEVATYGTYLEYGAVQRVTAKQAGWFRHEHGINMRVGATINLPPRPFMRETMTKNREKWQKVAQNTLQKYRDTTKALEMLGLVASVDVKDTVETGEGMARRSPLTLLMYSSDARQGGHRLNGTTNQTTNDKPLYRTGRLANSISFKIGGNDGA